MATQAPGGAGQNPAYRPTHHHHARILRSPEDEAVHHRGAQRLLAGEAPDAVLGYDADDDLAAGRAERRWRLDVDPAPVERGLQVNERAVSRVLLGADAPEDARGHRRQPGHAVAVGRPVVHQVHGNSLRCGDDLERARVRRGRPDTGDRATAGDLRVAEGQERGAGLRRRSLWTLRTLRSLWTLWSLR